METISRPMRVIARDGLRLRAGPGTDFDIIRVLPRNTRVFALKSVGSWTLADLQGDGAADGYLNAGFLVNYDSLTDANHVAELIRQGSKKEGLMAARIAADKALPQYPTNGCAAHLSALLQQAGINVPMTFGAGKLAQRLKDRGWTRVAVGDQMAGDVGVCYDNDPTPVGSDHVYLVVGILDSDKMLIADNQRQADEPHDRSATGAGGKTPTEYFLRAI